MTIVSALRLQFIRVVAFARALKQHEKTSIKCVLVHTGQHYDDMMSDVFSASSGLEGPITTLALLMVCMRP